MIQDILVTYIGKEICICMGIPIVIMGTAFFISIIAKKLS
jgi:hypothetical protein